MSSSDAAIGGGHFVTADDFSPVVGVVNWMMMCTTVVCVGVRTGMKIVVSRELNNDDFVISCAMLFSVAQSIALGVQASNGIGKHQDSLSQASLQIYEKAAYSSELFFICNMILSKISTLLLLRQITPVASHRKATLATMSFLAMWAITSIFASALQCATPDTWQVLGSQCFDQRVFWSFFGAVNIFTEILVIGSAIYFLWNVHITRRARATIMACFVIRISIVGAVIAQIIFLQRVFQSSDRTFASWPFYVSTIVVQNLSVITACVPFVRNFMLGLESGMIRIDDQDRRRKMSTTTYVNGSGNKGAPNSDRKGSTAPISIRKTSAHNDLDLELRDIDNLPLRGNEDIDNTTTIQTTAGQKTDENSQGGSPGGGGRIRATTEFSVKYEI